MKKYKITVNGSLGKLFFMTWIALLLIATVILIPFGAYLLLKTYAETIELEEKEIKNIQVGKML